MIIVSKQLIMVRIWNYMYIYRFVSENAIIVISFHFPDLAVVLMKSTAAFPVVISMLSAVSSTAYFVG